MSYTTYGLLKAIRSSHRSTAPACWPVSRRDVPTPATSVTWTRRWPGPPTFSSSGTRCQLPVELTEEERNIAASVLWTVKGDAGQRALMAWSMGWDAAREASGDDWMTGYLTQLMGDPYDPIRFIAGRSLRKICRCRQFRLRRVRGAAGARGSHAEDLRRVGGSGRPGLARQRRAAARSHRVCYAATK